MIILMHLIKQREKVGWHKLGKQYTVYLIALKAMKKTNLDSKELFTFSLNFSLLWTAIRTIIGTEAHI